MRILILFFPILLLPTRGPAQWALRAGYAIGQSKTLEDLAIARSGPFALLEYGFRLKKHRIEFHPGIGYRASLRGPDPEGRINSLEVDFGIAAYPFDFDGDCNCPTFSKEGDVLKKGFFLELLPGLSWQQFKRTANLPGMQAPLTSRDDQAAFKLGLSMGLDLGLSDRWTFTPMIMYQRFLPVTFETEGIDRVPFELRDQGMLGLGFRLKVHPDERRRRYKAR